MATGNWYDTDLYRLFGLIQSSMIVFPKELVIAEMRKFFSLDSFYHYVSDEWGFPKTLDHTDLPVGSGVNDDDITRIFIGENFRDDVQFYPSVIVKSGGMRSVPISMNREFGKYIISERQYEDGYGNIRVIRQPKAFRFEGAAEGSLSIDITTRSVATRDHLAQLIFLLFTDIVFDDSRHAGLVIKNVSIGSPSEGDDRTKKFYKVSINLEIRTEWKREIPIENYIERIIFNISIGNTENDSPVSPNLNINTEVSYLDCYWILIDTS